MKRHYQHVPHDQKVSFGNIADKYKSVVVDLETTGLNPRTDQIVGLAFAMDDVTGYYLTSNEHIDLFAAHVLADSRIAKVFHNAVFDVSMLTEKGYTVNGDIHDTMVMAHLLDPDRPDVGLKYLAQCEWGPAAVAGDAAMRAWLEENGLDKSQLSRAPQEIITKYAAEDAINTFGLFKVFYHKLQVVKMWLNDRGYEKTPWEYYKEECMPLFKVIVDMQLKGVRLDLDACSVMQAKLEKRVAELDGELREEHKEQITKAEQLLLEKKIEERKRKNKSGKIKKTPPTPRFNFDSNDHLKTLLFKVYGLRVTKKTDKGNISLNADYLETLLKDHPWAQTLLEYKELQKSLGMYFRFNPKKKGKPLLMAQEGGYIHATFNLIGTATGRFSSSNPNLQNLPKHGNIKSLFIPRPGTTFIYADYSQLELRIAAHLSKDPILLRAYREGLDLHAETAAAIFKVEKPTPEQRDAGKRINFAIIYNAGGWRIADILGLMAGLPLCTNPVRDWKCECEGCTGRKRAMKKGDKVIASLFGKYTGLKKYVDKQMESMLTYRMSISEFGRMRRLKNLGPEQTRSIRNHDLKAGFNLPIQSFGASLCKRAMIALWRKGYTIVNQIHDSILVEVPLDKVEEAKAEIKDTMESIAKLRVPLLAEPKVLTSFEEKGK